MTDFPKVQEDEVVLPVMDDYGMKCCDCALIHVFSFRAVKVTERFPDGSFAYDELDPTDYRVQLTASRPEKQPPWPVTTPRKIRWPGQPMCNGCPGYGTHHRCCVDPATHQYKPRDEVWKARHPLLAWVRSLF